MAGLAAVVYACQLLCAAAHLGSTVMRLLNAVPAGPPSVPVREAGQGTAAVGIDGAVLARRVAHVALAPYAKQPAPRAAV